MLLAGASAYFSTTRDGTFTFHVASSPSSAWSEFGSANMLLAGASAYNPHAFSCALAFDLINTPSDPWWNIGSAII